MFGAHRFLGLGDESGRVVSPIVCPRDECRHVNESIDIVCSSDECDQPLARWSSWFSRRMNRLIFVNGLRLVAAGVALAIGMWRLEWASYGYIFLLTFLFLSTMLREHVDISRTTRIIGAAVFTVVGWATFAQAFPISLYDLGLLALPVVLILLYAGSALSFRDRGRTGFFPVLPLMLGLLIGSCVLSLIMIVRPLEPFGSWLGIGQAALFGLLISGLVVGGVLAGVARRLTPLSRTEIRPPRIALWLPRRIPAVRRPYHMLGLAGPLLHVTDRLTYLSANSLLSVAKLLTNSCIRTVNLCARLIAQLMSAVATLMRRLCRRFLACVLEMVLLARDGAIEAYRVLAVFARRFAIPLLALSVTAVSAATLSSAITDYVWNGRFWTLGVTAVALAGLVGSVIVAVAGQMDVSLRRTSVAVFGGLIDQAVRAVMLFILLSVTLSFAGRILDPNPFAIGALTIGAISAVVLGVGYSYFQARRLTSTEPELVECSPGGAVVAVGPVVLWTVLLQLAVAGWIVFEPQVARIMAFII